MLEKVGSDPVPGTDQLASPVPHRGPKPTQGIEPRGEGTVLCPCPPSWAPRADDGHRTRDIHFGRVTLCQLSYIRICPEMLHRRGQSVLRCGRLAVHLTPIGAAATPQPVLTPEDLRAGRSRLVVGCGTAAAYPVPGTTRWYVCGSTPPHFSRRTPPGSRTPHPLIKSQVLWPDELEAHIRLCRSKCHATAAQTGSRAFRIASRALGAWAHGGAQSTVRVSAGILASNTPRLTTEPQAWSTKHQGGMLTGPVDWTAHHTIWSFQSSSGITLYAYRMGGSSLCD